LPFFGVFLVKDGKVEVVDKDPPGRESERYRRVSGLKSISTSGAEEKSLRYDIQANDLGYKMGRVLLEAKYRRYEKAGSERAISISTTGNVLIVIA